jgi:hypothetical protein
MYIPYWKEYREDKNFSVIVSPMVPMCDWDTGDSAWHPTKCITFDTKSKVIEFVEKEAWKSHLLFSLWKTKGGVHGVCLNWQLPCLKSYRIHKPLGVDPVYSIFTVNRGYVLRVSPKANRPEARPIHVGIVGRGKPLDENQRVEEAHTRLLYTYF